MEVGWGGKVLGRHENHVPSVVSIRTTDMLADLKGLFNGGSIMSPTRKSPSKAFCRAAVFGCSLTSSVRLLLLVVHKQEILKVARKLWEVWYRSFLTCNQFVEPKYMAWLASSCAGVLAGKSPTLGHRQTSSTRCHVSSRRSNDHFGGFDPSGT